ncbi:hypothetical protein FA13DRAFT_1745147 [Coprinellus micaceus]|uniref:F-box domain-containing protein n=1 Tax=Coprinellus micaceus TaxID=71717 RepID=A0A4Y7SBV9_COPMI|nr:hypothetical protein FA13DRAFT_1745147 [Coprinellus micaceus]
MDGSSPFSQYLNTNYAPSDSEIAFLKQLIQDREATAAALADKIEETKRDLVTQTEEKEMKLAYMEHRLAANRQFIEDHAMLLSPIRRVPHDVLDLLFQTFLESVEQPGCPESWPSFRPTAHPSTTISQVCADWRRVALQTRTLWTHIHVLVPHLNPARILWTNWCRMMETLRCQVETWINRSSPCAIDVGLRMGWVRQSISSEQLQGARKLYEALVEVLLPTSHRWRSMYCNWELQDTTESVLKLFHGPRFSLLRKANFFVDVDHNRDQHEQRARAQSLSRSTLFATPSLRDVTLAMFWENLSVAKTSSTSPLYESLTHLSFDANPIGIGAQFGGAEALDLLKSLPNLVCAQIGLHSLQSPPLRPCYPPIHLPYLTSLRLKFRPVPKGFAPSLHLPRLERLHLDSLVSVCHSLPSVETPNTNGSYELLLQEGPKLKELTLYHDAFPRESLARCLSDLLLNLTVLNVYAAPIRSLHRDEPDVQLLAQLLIPGSLPCLQELELHNMSNKEGGPLENAVVGFLAEKVLGCTEEGAGGRKCGGTERPTALRRVVIHFAHRKRVDIMGALRSRGCSLDGIDLGLKYRSRS